MSGEFNYDFIGTQETFDFAMTGNYSFTITEVISGGAKGADKMGEEWAKQHNIPIKKFPADWKKYGKAAGPIRNTQMAKYGEALIAIWDGKSVGTEDILKKVKKLGKPWWVLMVPK